MKKAILLILMFLLNLAVVFAAENGMLNEKWVFEGPGAKNRDRIEITFSNGGNYEYDAKFVNGVDYDYLYESGTYVFVPETNEVFVFVKNGSYDYLMGGDPPLHYGISVSNYQVYYKINKNEKDSVKAVLCRGVEWNAHKHPEIEIFIKETGGANKFINQYNAPLEEKQYLKSGL